MIEESRIEVHSYGNGSPNAKYVLYWMQQAQREAYNHALDYAIEQANKYTLPVLVVFCITSEYVGANARHYQFMLEGLSEVAQVLQKAEIGFVLEKNNPVKGIMKYIDNAKMCIMDKGYLRNQRQWRVDLVEQIKAKYAMPILEIDTDLIVPVAVASDKAEYAARTIRPKLWRYYADYDHAPIRNQIQCKWTKKQLETIHSTDITQELLCHDYKAIRQSLNLDESVIPSKIYHGGYKNAVDILEDFFETRLNGYKDSSPVKRNTSRIGMYLHFGQISSLDVMKRLYQYISLQRKQNKTVDQESVDGFIEQLFIRRELAYNYVYYVDGYDCFEGMTDKWAYQTMAMHKTDVREYIYTLDELIAAKTHDIYWNDAMNEMVKTGYMHNYMRMYWGKKIIEWSPTYEEAYKRLIYLNNRFFIDGRDANGYAGVAWCFGKHDHGWKERPVFGKLRYMNANGLKRKFKM